MFSLPGQKRWCGMVRALQDTGRHTATVKHGVPTTMQLQAWPPPSRTASSCSRLYAAAPDPLLCCVLKTATLPSEAMFVLDQLLQLPQ